MTDPAQIRTWQRIDDRLTTSGQPREPDLADIAALGVTHIVNLGLHDHPDALADEAASVRALGMAYTHLPIDFAAPGEEDYQRFRAIMDDIGAASVHVHCIANYRVSALLYRYRRDVLGADDGVERARMERIWRPGGAWAALIGDSAAADLPHRIAGQDY